jgi:eukaryotic-like serine/threonine-protein kinase
VADETLPLAEALSDRYRFAGEVGRGGMATVYRAEDLKHGRTVAVKVLEPELAASVGPQRFLEEIRITARLTHPHILPLLDSGEAAGLLYFVMPFIEGETLRDRMEREGKLPIPEAVRIAREVAGALAHAHGQGVLHRDIKPENILLSDGHALVADFGVARAVSRAGDKRLTETGLAVGTPLYMSPEQAAGEAQTDPRGDIYSLGCILYEMLAGEPPHFGATSQGILARKLTEPPAPVTRFRESVSPDLAQTLERALQRHPADRFSSADEFRRALATSVDTPVGGTAAVTPPPTTRRIHRALAGTLVFAALALILILVRPWAPSVGPVGPPSLLVLPLQNLGDPEHEYFADGITEELTGRLARVSGLRVTSRTTAARYKGSEKSLQEIARELGVAFVLEGTIRTDRSLDGTGQVRVTPQLIRVADDSHLWSEGYTASLIPGEVFRVQAEIAERVADALNVALLDQDRAALHAMPTRDPGAHEAYLLGRFHWNRRTADDLRRAENHFLRAIELDPRYAQAHAGLAQAYIVFPFIGVQEPRAPEVFRIAQGFADRALELDPGLADAWSARALARMYGEWDWEEADRSFQRALALDPLNPTTRYWHAELLAALGRHEEAESEARRGVSLDPTAPIAHAVLATVLLIQQRWTESEERYRQAVALEPGFPLPYSGLGEIARRAGRWDEARESLIRGGYPEDAVDLLLQPFRSGEGRAQAADRIADLLEREPPRDPGQALYYFGVLGDTARTLDRLREARESRHASLPTLVRLPWLSGYLEDPRFDEVLREMGLEP